MPASLYIFSDGRFGSVAGFALGNLEGEVHSDRVAGRRERRHHGLQRPPQRDQARPAPAFARVENFGRETVKVPLRLFRGGEVVDANNVEVSPTESRGVNFDFNAAGSAILELKADTDDQLALDDAAYAVINPPRRSHVLFVTTGNEPLRLALRTKEAAEVADVQIELPSFLKTRAYRDQAASGGWQLAIFDRCRPERMPAANTLFLGSLPPEGGWSAEAKTASPQIIDVETAHPLLQWIDMGDVLIAEAGMSGGGAQHQRDCSACAGGRR